MGIKDRIKKNEKLKELALRMLMPRNQARPRWWVSVFLNRFFHKRGSHSLIRRRVRLDVMPFNKFELGENSTIEDFSTINNGVGDVIIGKRTRIGLGSVVIGPVKIGNDVLLAQNIIVSGLNHGYEDINIPISKQPVTTRKIVLEDECWIGSNSVIVSGARIGKHSIVAAGSVVNRDVPDYCIVAGNPATIKKKYDFDKKEWVKV